MTPTMLLQVTTCLKSSCPAAVAARPPHSNTRANAMPFFMYLSFPRVVRELTLKRRAVARARGNDPSRAAGRLAGRKRPTTSIESGASRRVTERSRRGPVLVTVHLGGLISAPELNHVFRCHGVTFPPR